jgi:hypothetical protein
LSWTMVILTFFFVVIFLNFSTKLSSFILMTWKQWKMKEASEQSMTICHIKLFHRYLTLTFKRFQVLLNVWNNWHLQDAFKSKLWHFNYDANSKMIMWYLPSKFDGDVMFKLPLARSNARHGQETWHSPLV